jgi:hypothetical protein
MKNPTTEEDITALSEEWYTLIGPEHHKDRDCHWTIVTRWSYGQPPIYQVEHHGYILDHIEIECKTYSEALETLKKTLQKAISDEREFQALNVKEAQMALEIKKIEDDF